jgi:hypothetical protein
VSVFHEQQPSLPCWGEELDTRLTTLLCKKSIVVKSKEVKTELNLARSSKESCGSKRAVLTMMTSFHEVVELDQYHSRLKPPCK